MALYPTLRKKKVCREGQKFLSALAGTPAKPPPDSEHYMISFLAVKYNSQVCHNPYFLDIFYNHL